MTDWSTEDVRVLVGDVRARLAELPDASVHCVATSPPYWGLRDYGAPGQLGLEPTPEEYVGRMVEVFGEVRRVLRPDGTLWLNCGDSYASTSTYNAPRSMRTENGWKQDGHRPNAGAPIAAKNLLMMPARLALALQADGWWLRSDIIWAKPNPMPESVTDRPTTAHEHVFLLARSERYFYDAEAVREPAEFGRREWTGHLLSGTENGDGHRSSVGTTRGADPSAGRNLRSVWTIATQPYPEAHFATFPEELARRCIAAGTSERGCCPECGAPWRRMVDVEYVKSPVHGNGSVVGRHEASGQNGWDGSGLPRVNKAVRTTGWQPSCTHDREPIPATVLDPFAGSGTTLAVARSMGRRAVGIELQADYLPLIRRRVHWAIHERPERPAVPVLAGQLPLSEAADRAP